MSPQLLDYVDQLQPFLIHHTHIRGRVVRLEKVVNEILQRHNYPHAVSELLAELLVLAAMLSSNLKGEGILTLQAKGSGPVKFVVVDANSSGALRGYAELAEGMEDKLPQPPRKGDLKELLGEGYFAMTLDQGPENQRYQGIVELSGKNFSEALKAYFTQSQQVEIDVKLAVGRNYEEGKQGRWVAGGIMIERIPSEGGIKMDETEIEDTPEQWNTAKILLGSVRDFELLDPYLSPQTLLYRLFNEEGVWVYPPQILVDQCRCSRERIANVLMTLPEEDLISLKVKGKINVNCQFCNRTEIFGDKDIKAFLKKEK